MTGPFHTANLIAGAAAGLLGALIAPAFAADEPASSAAEPLRLPAITNDQQLIRTWKGRIERLARIEPITVRRLEHWPNAAGFTLDVDFAEGSGDTWRSVADAATRLAAAAQLPPGCVVAVSEGALQGTARILVPTVNALAEEVPLPEDVSPLTIWRELPVGVHADTSVATVELRQSSGLVVGQKGGGKTNLLLVLIGMLKRCPENLTWVVDLNGGGLAVPWTMPYVDGQVSRRPIDWIAPDPEEAIIMARVAAAIARDRKARYARLKARANTDLLPVSADLPQITIVVDEGAEVMGDASRARAAINGLLEVQRIGRAEGVNVIFSGLRATQDTLPVNVRKQCALKIATRVADDGELGYILSNTKGIRAEDLVEPGTIFLQKGNALPRQVRVYRTLPERITRIVLGTDALTPTLDEAGTAVGGKDYRDRWQRLEPWLAALRGEPVPVAPAPAPVPPAPTPPVPGTPEDRDEARERARRGLRQVVLDLALDEMPDEHVDAEFASLTGGGLAILDREPVDSDEDDDPDEVRTADTARGTWSPERLIELARAAKDSGGITPTEMRNALETDGIEVSNKTLYKWLERLTQQKRLDNNKGRYTALD
jgi:S-DNA-T family DNA segregation ATPase FtsK/SpoIIIE